MPPDGIGRRFQQRHRLPDPVNRLRKVEIEPFTLEDLALPTPILIGCAPRSDVATMSRITTGQGLHTMESFAGLNLSLDETHLRRRRGRRIARESRCGSECKAIAGRPLTQRRPTGSLSPWLHEGLMSAGFTVAVMVARHRRAGKEVPARRIDQTRPVTELEGNGAWMKGRSPRKPRGCTILRR